MSLDISYSEEGRGGAEAVQGRNFALSWWWLGGRRHTVMWVEDAADECIDWR